MVYNINQFINLKYFQDMEEKKLTERESISLIAEMISRTKERYIGDGNIMLMWGWLTIAVAGLVWVAIALTLNPAWNWLWFLIPVIGGIATPIMAKKSERKHGVKTYSDKISSQIWLAVGIIAIAATVVCMGFDFTGFHAWSLMFIYALIIVPMAEIVQGLIIREKSLVVGGAFGIAVGIFTTSCLICHITLYAYWFLPTFMLAFACMMLIPGYVINHKAHRK
jgi:hypothetical protein